MAALVGRWRVGVGAVVAVLALLVSVVVPQVATAADASGTRFLTLQFGRAQWAATDEDCTVLPGAVRLDRIAADLAKRGRSATAAVVIARTMESQRACWQRYTLHASWDDLAMLRDTYGWRAVSNGTTHDDVTRMTARQQQEEICGSLAPLAERGHRRAWALFAYGNDKLNEDIQRRITSTCFSYGRTYANAANSRTELSAPWFQRTRSVNGGHCNVPSLPCSSTSVAGTRYLTPEALRHIWAPGPDEWSVLQVYRLVRGSRIVAGSPSQWDCTAADPDRHWTSRAELYCYNDFLAMVDAIPPGVLVTDPATVANRWGRGMGG